MLLQDALNIVIIPGLNLLPEVMDTSEARAMLLAIGQQEGNRFTARRQYCDGPAKGFFQFECGGGVSGVLFHQATKLFIQDVLSRLEYHNYSSIDCHTAIEHNDALATVFARLLLWTLPEALPQEGDYEGSWNQYIAAWRPGKPHRSTWNNYYDLAWNEIKGN